MKDKIQALKNISEKLKKFTHERDWEQFHSPKNLAMALSVEVSEIIEELQWLTEEQSSNLSKDKTEKIRQEIADVFIYLIMLADKYDIDLINAAEDKIMINEKNYPVKRSKGNAKKYTEL
ncbi:MAG: nucleotide pyrophosphohydrolase [Candidatus Marinimicrobia bacterium]|nr:nucleotide pyrophosphohydrolase [Candidatus Neomarinimicrobiota bacterium]